MKKIIIFLLILFYLNCLDLSFEFIQKLEAREQIKSTEQKEIKNEKGMLIKQLDENKNLNINITNNILSEQNQIAEDSIDISIKILNKDNKDVKGKCNFNKPEKIIKFNISCLLEDSTISIEDDIEIIKLEHEDYIFTGFENKKTLSLNCGKITKEKIEDNELFRIKDNELIGDATDYYSELMSFELTLKDINTPISCEIDEIDEIDNNKFNISCKLKNINENINIISIKDNPKACKLDENTTLNYINFKDKTFYSITLEEIIKGECENNNYAFSILYSKILNELLVSQQFNLSVFINEVKKDSTCNILEEKISCSINNYSPPEDNYEINITTESSYELPISESITVSFDIPNNIITTTLISKYILKESCSKGIYKFNIYYKNNVDKEINGDFSLNLRQPNKDALCSYIYTNNKINCSIKIDSNNEDEKQFCLNMNKDIIINDIKDYKYIRDENNKILHLYGFKNLETITFEAGDLQKGSFKENNIYEFKLENCILYNKIPNEVQNDIVFQLNLDKPEGLQSKCKIPKNSEIEKNINIVCTIDNCPIYDEKQDLVIGNYNPREYTISSSELIIFKNFAQKSTIVTLTAGKLKKDQIDDKSYLIFDDSEINYDLKENILFIINYKNLEKEEETECIYDINKKQIKCEIKDINSNNINLEIISNPLDDYTSLKEKTIIFNNFEGQKIFQYTLNANKIRKGKCENKVYTFSFEDTQTLFEINTFKFKLDMMVPNYNFLCTLNSKKVKEGMFNNSISCSYEGTTQCIIEPDKDIIVENNEPDPIQINEYSIIYFSSFAGQNTFQYKISVGTLLKGKISDNCKYYFDFLEKHLSIKYLNKKVSFSFDMLFGGEKAKAFCDIFGENEEYDLSCYLDLKNENGICEYENIDYYDLEMEKDTKIEIIENNNPYQDIKFEGFSDKKTVTVSLGNIEEKKKENENFVFIIKNNKNIDKIGELNDNEKFYIDFKNSFESEKTFSAICNITKDNNIRCESEEDLSMDSDIIIIDIKGSSEYSNYIILNNKAVYFKDYENLRTYTIISGFIYKLPCKEDGQNYQFGINNNQFFVDFIQNKVEIQIEIKNENDKSFEANCTFTPIAKAFNLNCKLPENINCVQDIILTNNIKIISSKDLPSSYTIFFNEFKDRRTYSIIAGKLEKGECHYTSILSNEKQIYSFNFINNQINYEKDIQYRIDFLTKDEENQTINAICYISGKDKEILCNADTCPKEDIKITNGPKYSFDSQNSIWYSGFLDKETITIINNDGQIIKKEKNNTHLFFNITNNYVNEVREMYIAMNIVISKDEKKSATCKGKKTKDIYIFDFECFATEITINEEIEIPKNPEHDDYYFSSYENKKTLTLASGSLSKKDNEKKFFDIINNKLIGDPSNLNIFNNIRLFIDNETTLDCTINDALIIHCEIKDHINFEDIIIIKEPDPYLLNDSSTTLNYINFTGLHFNKLTLGQISKGNCDNNNIYRYIFDDTTLTKSLNVIKSFTFSININEETKDSICIMPMNGMMFNMSCNIKNYCPPDNYDITLENQIFFNENALKPNILFIDYPKELSTFTLKFGFIVKETTNNGLYKFRIQNNILNIKEKKISQMLTKDFKLKLKKPEKEAICILNIDTNNNFIINCQFNVNKEDGEEYYTNIINDIIIEDIIDNNYLSFEEDGEVKILHLSGYKGLETITVEGGDLLRGEYIDNIYKFQIVNSEIYNNIPNDLNFPLKIKNGNRNVDCDAECCITNKIKKNTNFNIDCTIVNINQCQIQPVEHLTINNNPGYRTYGSEVVNFMNFYGKSTIINVIAGDINKYVDKENKKYYLFFNESKINYQLKDKVSFTIKFEKNDNNKIEKAICNLKPNSNNITCEIDNIEFENMNITILDNPNNDIESVPKKSIVYEGFKNKTIYTFIAGKMKKGECIENNYAFYFENSKSATNISTTFFLKMKYPDKNALCTIKNESTLDVICVIQGYNTCPLSEDIDIIVGDEEPTPKILEDGVIMYFYSFAGKNTLEYNISLGNLLKSEILDCKYYFKFSKEPYELDFFTNDISFNFNILFNKNKATATCLLFRKSNEENKKVYISCYFDLDESQCKLDNLVEYDLEIEKGTEIEVIDNFYNIKIEEFDNQNTLTITVLAGNIMDKKIENKKIIFTLENNERTELLTGETFDLTFIVDENNQDNLIEAKCSFNNNIRCESTKDTALKEVNDIIIKQTPYKILNSSATLYFENFVDLRTFTITAGQIKKLKCKDSGEDYEFNIINTISSEKIPEEKNFQIRVYIDNEKINATCLLKQSKQYYMSCIIYGINCPTDIKFNGIENNPNRELFLPNTTFFKNFNNKRTITIKGGKIKKGECHQDENKKYYSFSIIDNDYPYIEEFKDITIFFNLDVFPFTKQAKCSFNFKEAETNIICNIDDECLNDDEDLLIKQDPSPNYSALYPNSIFYEQFANKDTTTIIMKETGKIIIGNIVNNDFSFIITDNIVNGNKTINELQNLTIKLAGGKEAYCNSEIVENSETFNFTCKANLDIDYDEIEIYENPIHDDYYFSGYKNKRTLTILSGSFTKDEIDNNKFYIINSKPIGNTTDLTFSEWMNIDIKYNDKDIIKTSCTINLSEMDGSTINISCSIPEKIKEAKTISIINNPETILISKEGISLNFMNYRDLTFYTVTLGKILKDKCSSKSFKFFIMGTTISKQLLNNRIISLPVKINNENEGKAASCTITKNVNTFNMVCFISNYCPDYNIDIEIKKGNYYDIYDLNSIYFDVPSNTFTTTLKAGYIKKIICDKGIYTFTINGNSLGGNKLEIKNNQFALKLAQFENEVSCSINPTNYIITCSLKVNEASETETKYCENILEDIKVEKLKSDYILNDNYYLHLYGFDILETFTVEGGDLNRGYCVDEIYRFTFINSAIYNNLLNENENIFKLNISDKPATQYFDAKCILPSNLSIGIFNLSCSIADKCNVILDKDLEVSANNPNDIISGTKRVNFKNFSKKSSTVDIVAGTLQLEKQQNVKYNLVFFDSTIDSSLNFDIKFNIKYNINNEVKKTKCELIQNEKKIVCELNELSSNDINIQILENPLDNYEYFSTKTVIFTGFKDKYIYTLVAGKIKKGKCNGTEYSFSFINSKCQYDLTPIESEEISFIIQMINPKRIAVCKIKNKSEKLYDVECTIGGTTSCPVEENEDILVGNDEPIPYQIDKNSYLYYSSFANQTTNDTNYNLNGRILRKNLVTKKNNNYEYNFLISECTIDKDLEEDFEFDLNVILEIYNSNNLKEELNANCILQKGISDLNNFDIECSFTSSNYYDDNYDIKIEKTTKEYQINEDEMLSVSIEEISTITLHGCQILKGKCNNKKYSYTFSSCILPKSITQDKLEFNLNTKTNEVSKCSYSWASEIKCEIGNYSLCDEGDIEIGDNNPIIDYSKYSSVKNFYISGLKNLYTSTLTGGVLNFGKCESGSYDYIYTFTNTKISKALDKDLSFDLNVIEPYSLTSKCKIPSNSLEFTLQCVINGDGQCPIDDGNSFKIEEITEIIDKNSFKPNTIYINNIINRNILTIKGGDMNLGECNDKKYIFSFRNSEIISNNNIQETINEEITFKLNLVNPKTEALCSFTMDDNNEKVDIYCSIEGNTRCPIFDYTNLKIGDDPSSDETSISPIILQFSNFRGKEIVFNNYYLSISEYKNNECKEDNYKFDLTTKFESDNIPSDTEFSLLALKNEKNEDINVKCKFPKDTSIGITGYINCNFEDTLDGSIKLNFDYIKFTDEIFIINLNSKKEFEFKDIKCPMFENDSKEISPKKNSLKKAINFIIKIITSYSKQKAISIYDNKGTKKTGNILGFKIYPKKDSLTSYFEEETNTCNCIVPENTASNLELSCSIENINDKESDYFEIGETTDVIKVDDTEVVLNGVQGLKIQNLYKENPKPTPSSDTSSDKGKTDTKTGMSKAAKIILSIVIILVVIIIALILLYFFYFRYKDQSLDSSTVENNQNNNNKNESNESNEPTKIIVRPKIKNDNQGDDEDEKNSDKKENLVKIKQNEGNDNDSDNANDNDNSFEGENDVIKNKKVKKKPKGYDKTYEY